MIQHESNNIRIQKAVQGVLLTLLKYACCSASPASGLGFSELQSSCGVSSRGEMQRRGSRCTCLKRCDGGIVRYVPSTANRNRRAERGFSALRHKMI